ncbi:DUF1573 domain-containing protein [candidate division GN15 bacterium]|nr:DUF1573 domain-containing protein [candidate division GN15 bacterium]
MRRWSAIIILCLLLIGSSALAGPKIEIPDSEFDFGKVIQHVTVSHSFWLKSVGDDTLRITKIVPGCGCTKAPVTDSVLAPGDSTRLEIIFETKRFRGLVAKRPYVETNAGPEKNYVKITADLSQDAENMRPLMIKPPKVDVSQFTEAPRRRARFQIVNASERDYKITLIDHAFNNFELDLPDKVKAGETVDATVTVYEDLIDEEFEQSVTFAIDDEFNTRYTVPVKREVRVKIGKS